MTALVSRCRPVVLMRLRNKMAPSDVEHQLKFLVYTLERASEVADQSGVPQVCCLYQCWISCIHAMELHSKIDWLCQVMLMTVLSNALGCCVLTCALLSMHTTHYQMRNA